MVFQTEKAMEEVGDKIDAADKTAVEEDLKALQGADRARPIRRDMTDAQIDDLKAGKEKLMSSAQKLFAKVYEQAQGAAGAAGAAGAGPDMGQAAGGSTAGSQPDDDVVDGDYREV